MEKGLRKTIDMVSNLVILVMLLVNVRTSEGATLNNSQALNNASCSYPGTPENGLTTTCNLTSFQPGDHVEFMCKFTYRPIGSTKRTCQSDGTWTGVQPRCEVFMCEELEHPRYGFVHRRKPAVTGIKRKYECYPNYKLKGPRFLQCRKKGRWSAKPPTCEHVCKNTKCGIGEMCRVVNGKPTCSCRENMDCTSLYDPVCGSDGITYINECIMNATSCQIQRKIRRIQGGHCVPGDVCSIHPISDCRAAFYVYFYNVSLGSCQSTITGGCHPSGWNGFRNKMECKNHCVKQDPCVMKPEHGPCSGVSGGIRWYYDASTAMCKKFQYGGCFGNPNNFRTRIDCLKRCGGRQKPVLETTD